jgi:hypothetical protein
MRITTLQASDPTTLENPAYLSMTVCGISARSHSSFLIDLPQDLANDQTRWALPSQAHHPMV